MTCCDNSQKLAFREPGVTLKKLSVEHNSNILLVFLFYYYFYFLLLNAHQQKACKLKYWRCIFTGYNADIICLQEVDKKVFERDLCPRLEEVGFSGDLRMKVGEVREGSAIFFRNDRFRWVLCKKSDSDSQWKVCLSFTEPHLTWNNCKKLVWQTK